MALFSLFRRNNFFSAEEKDRIINAIRTAEKNTSGELRVYIESRCRFVDPLDRAAEIFWGLKMDHTEKHNAVLVYVAVKDHQYAIFADSGIHQKLGDAFWNSEVKAMFRHFKNNAIPEGIVHVIQDVGQALQDKFPYDGTTDKNEIPDDIVFGK